jgi:hypothetical protein
LLPPLLLAQTAVPKICAYINTFISTYCLHAAKNVNGRNFFRSQELSNGTLFELYVLIAFILTGTEPEFWTAVGSRLHIVERRYVTAWNWFYAVFIILIKNMSGGKTFHPVCIQNVQNFSASDGLPHIQMSSYMNQVFKYKSVTF